MDTKKNEARVYDMMLDAGCLALDIGLNHMSTKIGEFGTCQCHVSIYSSALIYKQERIYIVVSIHKKSGKELIRFGNRQQVKNIIDSYNLGSKKPEINW